MLISLNIPFSLKFIYRFRINWLRTEGSSWWKTVCRSVIKKEVSSRKSSWHLSNVYSETDFSFFSFIEHFDNKVERFLVKLVFQNRLIYVKKVIEKIIRKQWKFLKFSVYLYDTICLNGFIVWSFENMYFDVETVLVIIRSRVNSNINPKL